MQALLQSLTGADYLFLVRIIENDFSFTDNRSLSLLLLHFEESGTPEARDALCRQLEHEIRYLGSADMAYLARKLAGMPPGVAFREIIEDVARFLDVDLPGAFSDEALLRAVVEGYVAAEVERMSPVEQRAMLEDLGVGSEQAMAFLSRSAGVFAVPALLQAFGHLVVDGLIKRVVFGAIGRIIGRRLSQELFAIVAARFPWWMRWIGPAAWSLSIGWTLIDVQGPAYRKTAPIVLYLGLCLLRRDQEADQHFGEGA